MTMIRDDGVYVVGDGQELVVRLSRCAMEDVVVAGLCLCEHSLSKFVNLPLNLNLNRT